MIDLSVFNNKKVLFHTLGCKLNFAESSYIGKQMMNEGFVKVKPGEQADVCIINTCTVTDIADRKSRQAIGKLHRRHPHALIVVIGCYAQLKPEEIANLPGVNLVLGANEKFSVLEHLRGLDKNDPASIHHTEVKRVKQFRPSTSRDDRTRYFLKVQDGCDYFCTYCTIPLARGKSRNASVAETVAMAQDIIREGAKEIVLTGVNIGDFGQSSGESFFDLLQALDNIESDVRFRISSIEPNLLSDEIITFVAQSKRIMPHFHIPLQSGSNEVLTLMKRKYNRELFAHRVEKIKSLMPDAFIGVDVIIGVHGETEELFEDSMQFIDSLDISQLHVFTYSERANTKMLQIEHHNSPAEKKRRSDILHLLSDKKTKAFYDQHIGKSYPVLWESRNHGEYMVGFTSNYIRVEKPMNRPSINTIEEVKLGGWNVDRNALRVT
jgi:threonylcarbamoyladenosine tRNA methylthiotransferase MtaB